MKKRLFGNNQHCEGKLKYVKEEDGIDVHCNEPATYRWWWYKNSVKCGRTLVRDYKMTPHTIKARKKSAASRVANHILEEDATVDAVANAVLTTTNMQWQPPSKYRGIGDKKQLSDDLLNVCELMNNCHNNTAKVRQVDMHVNATGDGTLVDFKYNAFNA